MPAEQVHSSKRVKLRPGMKRPASVISVQSGEIMVDAEFLAAKLGLSTELLKTEMRRGLVYSVAERGIDEDEGRTRRTFRYRARSWTVVVKPDWSLNDDGEPGQSPEARAQVLR